MAQVRPSAALAFLATSPLIAGEDAAAYDDLSARMSRMLTPSDILEQIWVRDVVDLTWETLRLRRLKAQFLTATAHEGLALVLGPLLGAKTSDQVAPRWAARDAQALVQVDAVLAAAGLDLDAAMARTFALKIDTVERIERMTAGGALPPQRRAARDRASSRELCDHAAARGGGGRGRRLCRCRPTCIFARARIRLPGDGMTGARRLARQPRQCTPEQGADHRRGQGARGPERAPPRPEPAGAQRSRLRRRHRCAGAGHRRGARRRRAARARRLHRRGAGRSHARAARAPRRHVG